MRFPLLMVGFISTFFVVSDAFFGYSVNIQLSKDISKSGGDIATALGKMSKGIDEFQKILADTKSAAFIGLKYDLIVVQNTLDLTTALMTKLSKYASDTMGVTVTLFQEIADDFTVINGIFSDSLGASVQKIDMVFTTTTKDNFFDILGASLTDIATQIGTIQTSIMTASKKTTEAELNEKMDKTAVDSLKAKLSTGATIMVAQQTVMEKMLKRTKSLAAYVKVVTTTVSASQASITGSSAKAVKNCDTASKGFSATVSDLKTYKMTLDSIYMTLFKFEDTIVTPAVPAVIDALNVGLYANLALNLNANIASGITASTLQSSQITSFTTSIAADLNTALAANILYANGLVKTDKTESCFATFSVDFNNILKLYGSDLQKCIDDEAETINNILSVFLIQNNYFIASATLVTDTIKQCVKASIMSSSSAGIRANAALCLNAAIMTPDFKEPFAGQSTAIQMAISANQMASMTRMMACQTNAKATYDADLAFYSGVFDMCAPA